MAIDLALKSTAITNRDATPRVPNNCGNGGASMKKWVKGYLASVTASLTTTSIIRMVEVPAHAIISDMWFQSASQAAGAFSIGVYRTTADGGALAFTSSDQFFATAISCASAVAKTECLNESTTNTQAKQLQPLWQAIGMTEPAKGTMLDIALVVTTTDVTTGTGAVTLEVGYTM